MAPPRLWLSFVVGVLVLAGCPRRFDPRASEIHSNNPETEAEFRTAHRKFESGDLAGAATALRQFIDKHAQAAQEPLLPVARFELGLCEYRRGEFDEALRLLAPFSAQIVEGEEATELHAVLADLHRRGDRVGDALREYELFYRSPQVRPLEQLYIRMQVTPLLPRLSALEQKTQRQRFGIETPSVGLAAAPARRLTLGLISPLSGKDRALGERVLHGVLWASQAAQTGVPAVELRVRDSNGGGAGAAVAELAREGVQAIIGSPVRAEALAIAAEAEKRGLPVLHLAGLSGEGGSAAGGNTFQLLRSNEARAESLAQHLSTTGLQSVAVLAPATPYGQKLTRAFVTALQSAAPGIKVLLQLTFAANATTFVAPARQILEAGPQALLVPATANQLELIAAQLSAIGALATYRVEKRETEPPVRLLLSSAEGMGERLIKNAGRYLQGAVLAPIAPGGAPVNTANGAPGRFVGYVEDGGGEPGALDALGYDAVQVARAAFATACPPEAGAAGETCSPAALSTGLRKATLDGATGPVSFDAAGLRGGPAWLLRVEASGRLMPIASAIDRRPSGVR
jgi:ABC-type branched-subunit amino acid transport system substrate-binding protein